MKNDPWMRLAASVRTARPEDREPSFGFTTRVLARVRAASAGVEPFFWEPLLRRAALCSALAVLLAAGILAVAANSNFALDDDPTDFELVMDQDWNP